ERREHCADAAHVRELSEAGFEASPFPLELLVDVRVAQAAQNSKSGCGRERVPAQGPGLVDRAARREQLHHVPAAAEGCERQAAADDLSQDGEVRHDAETLLRAAARDPEAGDHLI